MNQSEVEVCRKLLATHHLSVAERRALPDRRARLSVLVAAVQQALAETGWFPYELQSGEDIGSGAVLESRDGNLWVHEQHEVGVTRFSEVRSFMVPELPTAIRAYVHATGGAPIDGVAVDWDA